VTGLRRQLSLLGTAPGFRLLFLATLGSSLGTLLATVALVVDIKDRTNSGSWVRWPLGSRSARCSTDFRDAD